ncbi:MAG: dipeptidyl peptidase 3, partial [Bacteroidota bacterium]|nr:dipeptidyl peptidase 3 [Bacteroidota bacterium]
MNEIDFKYTDERFADIQMLRYRLNGFEELTLQQKKYIYYLSEATLAGRDITFDQFGRYNLLIRKTLEAVYTHHAGAPNDKDFVEMTEYLKRVWFSNGIYHHYGSEKFTPSFPESWFRETVNRLDAELLPKGWNSWQDVLNEICPVIFDPTVMPKRVNQADGEDLVRTSACNFYEGVSQEEVENYYASMKKDDSGNGQPSYGLNSKLVNKDSKLEELTYTTNGLYGASIKQIVYWLDKAKAVAENDQQREVLSLLIEYYETGDLGIFDDYSIAWLKEQEGRVDFINGFIEVYGDPLGIKGSWESLVEYKDLAAT